MSPSLSPPLPLSDRQPSIKCHPESIASSHRLQTRCRRQYRRQCRAPIGGRRLPLLPGCGLDANVNTAVNAGLPSAAVDCLFSPAADSMPPSMPSQCRAPIGGRRSNATPSRLPLLSGCGPDAAVHTESIARVDYVLIRWHSIRFNIWIFDGGNVNQVINWDWLDDIRPSIHYVNRSRRTADGFRWLQSDYWTIWHESETDYS